MFSAFVSRDGSRLVSLPLAASLLFWALLASVHIHHGHSHETDDSRHCSICLVVHQLSSADQPIPTVHHLSAGLPAISTRLVGNAILAVTPVYLKHPVNHGPPSV